MNTFRVLIAALLVATCTPAFCDDESDPMPPWDYQELRASATDGWGLKTDELVALRLLAWNRELSSREQEINNVLFWLQLRIRHPEELSLSKPDVWALISMSIRVGRDKTWWENARIGRRERPGIWLFENPPKNEDVYRFLGNGWTFSSTDHFRLLGGVVRQRTWGEVIGEPPAKLHTGETLVQP